MSDLTSRLRALEAASTRGDPGMAPDRHEATAGTIRRRRSRHAAAIIVTSAAAVVVAGGIGWGVVNFLDSTPVLATSPSATPSPSVTPSPSTEASPTPTPEAEGPPSLVDDATALSLTSPATGESWHDRVAMVNAPSVFDPSHDYFVDYTLFAVGARGDAIIAAAVSNDGQAYHVGRPVLGLFEIEPVGTVRFIACPSSRAADNCLGTEASLLAADVIYDTSVHYDSLTYPESVIAPGVGEVRINALTKQPWGLPASSAFGEFLEEGSFEEQTVGTLGSSALLTLPDTPIVPSATAVFYGVKTPFGTVITQPWSPPILAAYESVTWEDGSHLADLTGDSTAVLLPPALGCVRVDVVTVPKATAGAWTATGTTGDGRDVLLPSRNNPLAIEVFEALVATSAEGTYRFTSLEGFLDARALVAIERDSDTLMLAVNSGATAFVWDCL